MYYMTSIHRSTRGSGSHAGGAPEEAVSGTVDTIVHRRRIPQLREARRGTDAPVSPHCGVVTTERTNTMCRMISHFSLFLLLVASPLSGQQRAVISGQVLDRESQAPVLGASVGLQGTRFETVTSDSGGFAIYSVPAGTYTIVVEHVAYGSHSVEIEVEGGVGMAYEILVSRTAIELAPLVVRGVSQREVRIRSSGSQANQVSRAVVVEAAQRGVSLGNLLSTRVPGVRSRTDASSVGSPVCVEFRGSRMPGGPCNSPIVVLDGLPVPYPELLFETIPLETIETVEVLSPAQAGVRYGTLGSANGVVLIETRPPMRQRRVTAGGDPISLRAYDWRLEPEPHHWKRVFTASLIGNAAGVALGTAIAGQCISFDSGVGTGPDCGAAATIGSGVAALAVPTISGSLAGQWAGGTDQSYGQLLPSALGAAVAVTAGYAFFSPGTSGGLDLRKFVGGVVLFLGPPIVHTLADHLLRRNR